ncbi:hypothetical protein NA57DRAFT_32434 [Rhizodiscina lignyota]|uniref:UFSP1/2/DUB catalytic domain-containing protein n=1 Tax=Rhizodiscina lignyota TaxID=1504668 RepID=A0A9P4IQP4_9PEZI|nr:hypothetical protein NA57DRAFT_32434 [Rhizodiscina lignyota]
MPDRVARIVEKELPTNKVSGVINLLADLLEKDQDVEFAYLCDQSVTQICKLRGEGNHFCAYRNIQMMLPEPHPIYSILELQEMIEKAWNMGFNDHGRIETGGITGTRKHIGTSEAQALLQSLNLPCKAAAFTGEKAWLELLDSIEAHFTSGTSQRSDRIIRTNRSPIFLQRPSHSLTIVGIERDQNGKRRLLVFDPGYRQLPEAARNWDRLTLYYYRRDERYLSRYSNFETLTLVNKA